MGQAQLFSLGITKALSPNTLNEFHLSYMRFANRVGQPVGGVGPKLSDQGFVEGPGTLGIVPLAPKIEGIENVSFNDFTFGVDTTGETQVNNTYQWTDNFSKVIGKHSLKVGGGLHLDQVNVNPDAVFNGSFQFEGTETGSDFADFLLGVANYYQQGDSKSFYLRNKYVGLFAQDSWQVRPNVTLTYGLRWDVLPPGTKNTINYKLLHWASSRRLTPARPKGWFSQAIPEFRNARSDEICQLRSAPGAGVLAKVSERPAGKDLWHLWNHQRARGIRRVLCGI